LRYKKAYGNIVNNYKELTADELKRKFISYPLGSISVPPLQIYLKQKKMTFRELLCILGQDEERKI
jgi:hypothetical protein